MSTAPSVPISPFEPITTPTIERANRLISVRTNPGFLDIIRISQDLVSEANLAANTFPGWDKDQLFTLHIRAKVAQEYHDLLLFKINEAISAGVEEARESRLPQKTVTEALDQGDYVRQQVLTKFKEYDSRPSGSY